MNLSKESSQVLGGGLQEKRSLAPGITFHWYRKREREFRYILTIDKAFSLVYCNNFAGLIEFLGLRYDGMEWRLFIDSSKWSLKAVLLNKGNKFSSVPVGHPVEMKESHKSMELILSALNYQEHKWLICGDLKVVGIILGVQGGYTKYPCFLCLWDSCVDDQHYVRQEWPWKQGLKPGSRNVLFHSLVEPSKTLFPLVHMKLGLMKNFVKPLDRESRGFSFLHQKSQRKCMEKIKAGYLMAPQKGIHQGH